MKHLIVTLMLSLLIARPAWAMTDFDNLTLLDNCNRTEAPLSNGGQWTTDVISTHPSTLTANGTTCVRSGTAGIGSAWWNPTTFGPNLAVVATMPGISTGTTQYLLLYVRLAQPGVPSATNGYFCAFATPIDSVGINRIDSSSEGALTNCPGVTLNAGDKVACEVIGTTLSAYRDQGSGWQSVCTANDATYTSAGAVGIGTTAATVTMDTIRAGNISAVPIAHEGLMPAIQ